MTVYSMRSEWPMLPATTWPEWSPMPVRTSGKPRFLKFSLILSRRERISSAALTALSGSFGSGTGAPNTAMIASPMNLSTTPW